ncbi:hypothetical protein Leryth_009788 [Lithospermum erythrorhizon]|nr:hypothetical protein Leryth_009788 [Lithospermum erythrorhizon]
MLVAFEGSGLIRFALLLIIWPLIRLLEICGKEDVALKLTIFLATTEIEAVARAVLPKFYYDDIDMDAWRMFSSHEKRVVVTKTPRIIVERFVKEHLRADGVVGSELEVNRFGLATGFIKDDFHMITNQVAALFGDQKPYVGLARPQSAGSLFLALCQEQYNSPIKGIKAQEQYDIRPQPVIFHDGRLAKRPTPLVALLILLWIPIGIILASIRIFIGFSLPMWALPYISPIFGGKVVVKGNPPSTPSNGNSGVLFVCTHRSLMDPVVLSTVLQRRIPAVTYSISRLSEILSPIPTVRLTRIRDVDAENIKKELEKGDLVVCPEGTTCREPFLLRFSALFAELTDRIVPVAMNYRVGLFHATTARGWKGMDPVFFFMNPRPIYEVTFLNQLPAEATCSSGKSPHDVANYVQRLLAATLGFECTTYTRKDKYRVLAGNDGIVSHTSNFDKIKKIVTPFKHVIGTFKPFLH